jgi:hypothetical protein
LKKAISRESESALPSYALPSLFPPVFEHPWHHLAYMEDVRSFANALCQSTSGL